METAKDMSVAGCSSASDLFEVPDTSYEDYLKLLLEDYGLDFSPGGSGIVVIEQPHLEIEDYSTGIALHPKEEKPTLKSEETTSASQDSRKRPLSSSDEESSLVIDEASAEASSSKPRLPKKPKVYEQKEPLSDPEQERRRINAILAKKNRDEKKKQVRSLEEQVEKLKHVNMQCAKLMRRANMDVRKLRQDFRKSETERLRLQEQLTNNEQELRKQREKLVLFRSHLDLICSSMEEDSPTRRIINVLLDRLPARLPTD